MNAILTPAEYAREAGRSKSWAVARCADGTLPAVRLGSRWLLRRADLIRDGWLLAHNDESAAPGKVAAAEREG